jgi:acetoin:2,6-dichlorophenolindophenol oxidoreductase subunit beta
VTIYIDCIREALDYCVSVDSKVYLIGEDLLDPYGGAFKATRGLSSKYPGRVLATPISESAIIGISTGMAMRGLLPVAEIMFGDFLTLCVDQIVNSATKFPLMYKGGVKVPAVIRTPVSGARGYGPTHSQSLEKIFFGIPGLTVVAPNRLANPGLLLKYAILEEENPTLFIEDKGDYGLHIYPDAVGGLVVESYPSDSAYPTVIARNFKNNKQPDVILVSYGGGASLSAMALDELAEDEIYGVLFAPTVVNDIETLKAMINLFPRNIPIIIAEQGTFGFGWSSELMALMLEAGRGGEFIKRLAARPGVIPAARHLESEVILNKETIKGAILEVLK